MDNTNNEQPINLQKKEPEKEGVLDDYVSGYQELEIEGYRASIRKASNWLFGASALFVVVVLIQVGDILSLLPVEYKLVLFGFPAALVILAILTPKKPVLCLTLALILYVSFYIIMTVWTGEAAWLYGGIVIKILVIGALLKGLKDAKEAEQLKKDFEVRGNQP